MSYRYREERPRRRVVARRPVRRQLEKEACDLEGPPPSRSRGLRRDDNLEGGRPRGRRSAPRDRNRVRDMPRDRDSMRGRRGLDEEYTDLNLDEILEVEEDEVLEEEGLLPLGDEMPLEEGECPPGCAPVEEDEEKPEGEEEEDDKEDKDEPKDKKKKKDDEKKKDDKEDKDEKEAAVQEPTEAAATDEVVEATTDEPAAEPVVTTAKWAPIYTEADISRIGKDAEVTLVPFLDQEDPIYVVMANARPVGEIRRSDLGLDEDQLDMFVHETFPRGIIEASEQLGADKVLGDIDVRYYATQVTQAQADNAAKTAVQSDLEEAFQTRSAELKNQFVNNVLLAVEASSKNIFLTNPLRDAIQKNFRQAGIPDAVVTDLFEASMQESGADYFQAMIKQADEWLGFEKEALVQVEQMVRDAGYRTPVAQTVIEHPAAATPPVQTMAPRAPQREAAAVAGEGWENSVKGVLRNTHFTNRSRR